jgi:hypothetical protein
LTLFGTFFATWEVNRVGATLGVSSNNDPATWFVFAGGIVVAILFAAVGYALGMLCAIYDRQEVGPEELNAEYERAARPREALRQRAKKVDEAITYEKLPPREVSSQPVTPPAPAPGPPAAVKQSIRRADVEDGQRAGPWEWLTRERHLLQPRDD